jgi:hypothetical protein
MNSKILIAFVAGAVIASGIVYMAVREEPGSVAVSKPAPVVPSRPAPAPPPTHLEVAAPMASSVEAAAATAPVIRPLIPSPVRQKPSPMPPPVRRENSQEKPTIVARVEPAPQPSFPEPAWPEPVREPVKQQPDPPPIEAQIPSEPPPPSIPRPVVLQKTEQPPSPETRTAPTVTIAAGTLLPVRIGETISASHYQSGDSFLATLDRPLVVDGWVIAEKGSRLEGRVAQAKSSRGSGGSYLEVELVKLSTADGQHIQIRTKAYRKEASSSTASDLTKVGVGAALGAAIGGMAGGGKGAAIGVGAGAAAGAAGAAITHGKPAEIPVESRISFRIADPITITERSN